MAADGRFGKAGDFGVGNFFVHAQFRQRVMKSAAEHDGEHRSQRRNFFEPRGGGLGTWRIHPAPSFNKNQSSRKSRSYSSCGPIQNQIRLSSSCRAKSRYPLPSMMAFFDFDDLLKSKSQAFRTADGNCWLGQFGVCFDVSTNI